MEQKKFILVTGGTRSGKSAFAERLAAAGGKKVIYLATATVGDEEMALRVERHRQRRPPSWETVEEPLEIAGVINRMGAPDKLILVDCLTLFLNNLLSKTGRLFNDESAGLTAEEEERILGVFERLCKVITESPADIIIVTNEVGWGLVPPYPAGRVYRDLLGTANQRLARLADEVYLVVSGLPLEIKSLARELWQRP
ncbi:MAG: bifunctional adenosylcobinamide kinase/adenosylcobinamide-phosphate guanylyltransferase [Bacillota bacterium]